METKTTNENSEACAGLAAATGSTFGYEFRGLSSRINLGGTVEFDRERKQWKATIIAQRSPEIRFEAWDDDSAVAGLMACAKWMGRDMSNVEMTDGYRRPDAPNQPNSERR